MSVKEAIQYIKKYDGFKELRAIGVIVVAIYNHICGGKEEDGED